MRIKDILSEKKLPAFMTGSKALASDNALEKIFPKIGLPNSKAPAKIKKLNSASINLDKVITLAINKAKLQIRDNYDIADMKTSEQFRVSRTLYVFDHILSHLRDKRLFKYSITGEPISNYAVTSFDKTVLYKAGTNLYKLTEKLLKDISNYGATSLIKLADIEKSLQNVEVVFSSDGKEGFWDITTMSMRGIKSCMRWDHSSAPSLVGSVLDPYCGIIYLSDGSKTEFGTKMLYRALVRIVKTPDDKFAIMLDRLYSAFYKFKPEEGNTIDNQVRKIFLDHLKKTTKLEVLDAFEDNRFLLENCHLPRFEAALTLINTEWSYRDTNLIYTDNYVPMSALSNYMTATIVPVSKKKSVKKVRIIH